MMARTNATARNGARAGALGGTYFPPQQADGHPDPRGSRGSTGSGRGAGTEARAVRRVDNPSVGGRRTWRLVRKSCGSQRGCISARCVSSPGFSSRIQDAMFTGPRPALHGRTVECPIDLLMGALIGLVAPVMVLGGVLIVRLAALRLGTFARWLRARADRFDRGIAARPNVRRMATQPGGSRAAWIRNALRVPVRFSGAGGDVPPQKARRCPACGHSMSVSARFCRSCGADPQP